LALACDAVIIRETPACRRKWTFDTKPFVHVRLIGFRAIGCATLRSPFHQAALDGTFGSLRPDLARRVRLVEHIRQAGAVMGGGVAHRETAHEAIGAIDRDMIFCSRTPERRFRPWASHLHPPAALARFKVQRASRSFWAIFAGEPSRFSPRPCAQSITATSIARSFSSRPFLSS